MFRLIEPSSGQNHSIGTFNECVRTHWMYQYYGLYLAWWWLNKPKHVAEFLILIFITNVCCVIDEINLLYEGKLLLKLWY